MHNKYFILYTYGYVYLTKHPLMISFYLRTATTRAFEILLAVRDTDTAI